VTVRVRRNPAYEVAVVGGGPAGLTAALYTTRLGHWTALIDGAGGRHEEVSHVHNLLGVAESTSGAEPSGETKDQIDEYGAEVYEERVESIAHYCLHRDAYGLADGPVFVLGHDDHVAHVALVMLNFTDHVDLLPEDADPEWSGETAARIGGLEFADGDRREYLGGFATCGRSCDSGLARDPGCELNADGSVRVDDDGRPSVGESATGDLTHGQNQPQSASVTGAGSGRALQGAPDVPEPGQRHRPGGGADRRVRLGPGRPPGPGSAQRPPGDDAAGPRGGRRRRVRSAGVN
jgi:thioredoxin reductase (NADPH)